MPTLSVEKPIAAPALVCFDLARDMDVHARLFLTRYLRRFLARRGQFLKEVASELSDEGAFRVTW